MIRLLQNGLLAWFICCSWQLIGQNPLVYTQKFTNLLQDHELAFQKPEGWFKVLPWRDDYLKYDLVLRSDKTGMDMRFKIYPMHHPNNLFPDFGLTKMVTRIASSEDHHLVFYKPLKSNVLNKTYGADWGMLVTFTPNPKFSDKERGKILALQRDGKGSIYMIILFDGSSEEVAPYLTTFTFANNSKSKSG